MGNTKRQYSDTDKATALAALDANGGNVAKTARELGIPRPTLHLWANGKGVSEDVSGIQHVKKGELADKLEELSHVLAGDLFDEERRARSSVRDTAIALGVAIDKMQLLRGEPTEVIDNNAAESLDRKLATLFARTGAPSIPSEPDTAGEGGT